MLWIVHVHFIEKVSKSLSLLKCTILAKQIITNIHFSSPRLSSGIVSALGISLAAVIKEVVLGATGRMRL